MNLAQFFADRPALSKRQIAAEAGISNRLLDYLIVGERSLTDQVRTKLTPILQKYGMKPTIELTRKFDPRKLGGPYFVGIYRDTELVGPVACDAHLYDAVGEYLEGDEEGSALADYDGDPTEAVMQLMGLQ